MQYLKNIFQWSRIPSAFFGAVLTLLPLSRLSLITFAVVLFLPSFATPARAVQHYDTAGPHPVPPSDLVLRENPEKQSRQIPIMLNDSVEEYIDHFTTEKITFQQGLNNAVPYLPHMKQIFSEERLPEELVYVVMIESLFDPTAVSGARAAGIWQFMPDTARAFGLRNDKWVDERRDYLKSTRAAARYLKALHARLQSWPLVMAAYNAGAGTVRRAIALAGSGDFWDLRRGGVLRKETKTYVPKVMAAAIIGRDPAAYGFNVPDARPIRFDVVEITKSTDLRVIARQLNCSVQHIRGLNPEIKGVLTPPRQYLLRVPEGKRRIFLSRTGVGRKPSDLSRLSRPSLPLAGDAKEV